MKEPQQKNHLTDRGMVNNHKEPSDIVLKLNTKPASK